MICYQTHPHLCLTFVDLEQTKTAKVTLVNLEGCLKKTGDGESSVVVFLGKTPPQEVSSRFCILKT